MCLLSRILLHNIPVLSNLTIPKRPTPRFCSIDEPLISEGKPLPRIFLSFSCPKLFLIGCMISPTGANTAVNDGPTVFLDCTNDQRHLMFITHKICKVVTRIVKGGGSIFVKTLILADKD